MVALPLATEVRLSDPKVRRRMGADPRGVAHYARTDAIRYFEAWADLLEEQLPTSAELELLAAK